MYDLAHTRYQRRVVVASGRLFRVVVPGIVATAVYGQRDPPAAYLERQGEGFAHAVLVVRVFVPGCFAFAVDEEEEFRRVPLHVADHHGVRRRL